MARADRVRRSRPGWGFAALAVALLPLTAAAAAPRVDAPPPRISDRVAADIAQERADKQIPAVAIALVGRDGRIWSQAWGFADADRKRPASPSDRYRLRVPQSGLGRELLRAVARPQRTVAASGAGEADGAVYAEVGAYDGPRLQAPRPGSAGPAYRRVSVVDLAEAVAPILRGSPIASPRREWQGGAPGYTAEVLVEPRWGQAVVVLCALDHSQSARRLADHLLRSAQAERQGRAPPVFLHTVAIGAPAAKRLAGWFTDGRVSLVLRRLGEALFLEGPRFAAEVRRADGRLYLDDANSFSSELAIDPAGAWVRLGHKLYRRRTWRRPAPPTAEMASLVGDYGAPDDEIRIFERDGRLYGRLDYVDYVPLRRHSADVWVVPTDDAQAPGARLRFRRNRRGQILAVVLNGSSYPRRDFGADALTRARALFRVDARTIANARKASPPVETGRFRAPDLVALREVDPALRLDIRYATADNFAGAPVYDRPAAYMQRPAAEAVARADAFLRPYGFGLLIHDSYRPWYVTKVFWDATPPEGHIFVADPSEGSRHNRGEAVDLTLFERSTGRAAEMTGRYDEQSSRSYPNFTGGTSVQRWRRDLLRRAMERVGFEVYPFEWWHFDFQGWRDYPILNLDFDQIDAARRNGAAPR